MVDRNRYSIDEFSDDVRRILDAQGETTEAVWSLGPLLQRLARELEPIGDPDSEAPSGEVVPTLVELEVAVPT